MARTYSLKAETTLTLTSSAGNTINTVTDNYTFATLTADESKSGIVSIANAATEQINVQTVATRALLYVKNNNASGGSEVAVKSAGTTIITLKPEEWMFAPVTCSSNNITVTASTADSEIIYLIIEQ